MRAEFLNRQKIANFDCLDPPVVPPKTLQHAPVECLLQFETFLTIFVSRHCLEPYWDLEEKERKRSHIILKAHLPESRTENVKVREKLPTLPTLVILNHEILRQGKTHSSYLSNSKSRRGIRWNFKPS